MILYEVELEIRDEIFADYRAWLSVHVEHMLELPGFVAAEILERREPPPPEGAHALTVHYRLTDDAAMQRYLAEHAPRLRAEGVRRFGDRFTATRRILVGSVPHGLPRS